MNLFSMSNCKSVSFGKICKQKRPFMRTAAVLLAMCITAGSVMGCGALSTQSSGAETEQASAPSPDAGQDRMMLILLRQGRAALNPRTRGRPILILLPRGRPMPYLPTQCRAALNLLPRG